MFTLGELTSAVIDSAGTGYTARPSGSINALPYYFCKITGDGSGAVVVTVLNGSITEINIVRGGQDYNFANIDFSANKVYATLTDLDRGVNSLDPEGNGDFRSSVIIPPVVVGELTSLKKLVLRLLASSPSLVLTRATSSIMLNIVKLVHSRHRNFTNQPLSRFCHQGIKVSDLGGIVDYQIGETISQQIELGDADKTLVNARGIVVGWDATNGIVSTSKIPNNASTPTAICMSLVVPEPLSVRPQPKLLVQTKLTPLLNPD